MAVRLLWYVVGSEAPSCLFLQDSNRSKKRLPSSGLFLSHLVTPAELVISKKEATETVDAARSAD